MTHRHSHAQARAIGAEWILENRPPWCVDELPPWSGRLDSGRDCARRRVADHGLELVIAAVARPEMADAVVVEILAPLRSEQRFAALRTGSDRPGQMKRMVPHKIQPSPRPRAFGNMMPAVMLIGAKTRMLAGMTRAVEMYSQGAAQSRSR